MKIPRTVVFIIAIAVILLTVTMIYISRYKTKTIKDFLNNDIKLINRIDIMDGSNGNILTIDDKNVIGDIRDFLSKLRFTKIYSEPSTGWDYRVFIYENNKQKLEITFLGEKRCIFNNNGVKYIIEKSTDVSIESLYNKAKNLNK